MTPGVTASIGGALAIAAVSTLGDFIWATWIPRHLPVYGLIHGAVLFLSIGLFLVAYVLASYSPGACAVVVAASAAFFLRYALLQSKHLGVAAAPLATPSGLVPAQKWIVLLLFAIVGGTGYPKALLAKGGEGPLLVTTALLSVLAAVLFVLALVRSGWPKVLLRRASFSAGILLAFALTAVLVELESWDRARYRVFASACIVFLVVLPFLKGQTKLFEPHPHLASLVPPAILSMMMAPSRQPMRRDWWPGVWPGVGISVRPGSTWVSPAKSRRSAPAKSTHWGMVYVGSREASYSRAWT